MKPSDLIAGAVCVNVDYSVVYLVLKPRDGGYNILYLVQGDDLNAAVGRHDWIHPGSWWVEKK